MAIGSSVTVFSGLDPDKLSNGLLWFGVPERLSFSIAFAKEMRERNVGVTAISPAGVATDFYGLSRGLQRLGCRLGVLMTPEKVARKALRALFARRRHIVPGWYNRLFIPFCTGMPDPCVRLIRRKTARFRH